MKDDAAHGNKPGTGAPRTQWDAIVEIIKLFGSAAPSVVILVGAVYAVMAFQKLDREYYDQLNKARDDATKEFREQIKTANEVVIRSSTTMSGLSKAQLQTLQQTTDLQEKARDRQKELEEQIREKEAVIAREEQQKRVVAASLETLKTELTNLEKTHDVATKTLGTSAHLLMRRLISYAQ